MPSERNSNSINSWPYLPLCPTLRIRQTTSQLPLVSDLELILRHSTESTCFVLRMGQCDARGNSYTLAGWSFFSYTSISPCGIQCPTPFTRGIHHNEKPTIMSIQQSTTNTIMKETECPYSPECRICDYAITSELSSFIHVQWQSPVYPRNRSSHRNDRKRES